MRFLVWTIVVVLIAGSVLVARGEESQGLEAAVREHLEKRIGREHLRGTHFLWPATVPRGTTSFRVISDQWDTGAGAAQLRVACSPSKDCLPFYVMVKFEVSAAERKEIASRMARPIARAETFPTPVKKPERARAHKKPALTQAGGWASMTVEGGGIHIFTQVICLERGVEGQIIRVRNPESKRVLRAQVVGPGRVRGPV